MSQSEMEENEVESESSEVTWLGVAKLISEAISRDIKPMIGELRVQMKEMRGGLYDYVDDLLYDRRKKEGSDDESETGSRIRHFTRRPGKKSSQSTDHGDDFILQQTMRANEQATNQVPVTPVAPVMQFQSTPFSAPDSESGDLSARRERERRRSTIFGEVIPTTNNVPNTNPTFSQAVVVNFLTRDSFASVELRSLNLEHLTIFLDEYSRILERHRDQKHSLRMVDFINRSLHPKITMAALKLGHTTQRDFGQGIFNLPDIYTKDALLELVKAKSPDDFIQKMNGVKFPLPEGDRSFIPGALNFHILFQYGMLYSHRFTQIIQMIAAKADPQHIPPLYKEGKTLGIVDHFLDGWPQGSGNSLYARVCISKPEMRKMQNFQSFTTAFFLAIEEYKEIQQQVTDLDSTLKKKPFKRSENEDNSFKPRSNEQSRFKEKLRNYEKTKANIFGQKQQGLHHVTHAEDDLYESYPEHDDFEEQNDMATSVHFDDETFGDSEPVPTTNEGQDQQIEVEHPLQDLAVVTAKAKGEPGCWYHFRFDNCTKKPCPLGHDKESMIRFQDQKLREIIFAKNAEPEAMLRQKLDKLLREKASAPVNKKA
jgi:hypothetical protein